MTSRSLTESFTFMRNNALQNRAFFADQRSSDRESLVPKSTNNRDAESGKLNELPMEWQQTVNAVQCTFAIIEKKFHELITLHDRHLMAANLDDNLEEDQEINEQTKELTEVFSLSHRQLNKLSNLRKSQLIWHGSQGRKLAQNVLSNLARTLQDLSLKFRKSQSEYLNKLKSRDDRIRGYLRLGSGLDTSIETVDELGDEEYQLWAAQKQQRNLYVEQNTQMVVQREQEINEIVRSIHELNEIFRDVAQLVVDQGTIVDRIDYNVENTQIRIEHALTQLTKAQKHQSKDRKMVIIMILASLIVIFGLLLVATKFR